MSTVVRTPRPRENEDRAPDDEHRSRARPWAGLAAALAVAAGVALRLRSPSALWLDEAISANISALPLGDIPHALRRDGAPPLYPLLLWGWERLFGSSPTAVRSLSVVFGVAALPLAYLAGSRLAGRVAGAAALLLLASSPFAIYYSSESRMYSLVVLLVLCGVLVLLDYFRRPGIGRGVLIALLSAALALTHYWALFLLAVVAGWLAVSGWRAHDRTRLRVCGWIAAGGLLFLPWLPTFLFQTAHTGTPWGSPAGYPALLSTLAAWSGENGTTAGLLGLLLVLLAAGGATVTAAAGPRLELDLRGRPPGGPLAMTVLATLVLALTAGLLTRSVYAPRYTSVVLPLFLLAAAVGVARLPRGARTPVLVLAVAAGLAGAVPDAVYGGKTQAPIIAAALRTQATPGDVVVYCPDQLGPATSRLLPASLRLAQEVYPTQGPPELIDWVDYATRNGRADPVSYARKLSQRAGDRAVWLVSASGYRTFGNQCETLAQELTKQRGTPLVLVEADPAYFEDMQLRTWGPVQPAQ